MSLHWVFQREIAELLKRTGDVEESLEYQTATSNVLQAIGGQLSTCTEFSTP